MDDDLQEFLKRFREAQEIAKKERDKLEEMRTAFSRQCDVCSAAETTMWQMQREFDRRMAEMHGVGSGR